MREIIHDSTETVNGDNGATTGSTVTFFTTRSGVIPITNIDVGYDVLKSLKLSVGAENVFNRYPGKVSRVSWRPIRRRVSRSRRVSMRTGRSGSTAAITTSRARIRSDLVSRDRLVG